MMSFLDAYLIRHLGDIAFPATLRLRKHNDNKRGCRAIAAKGCHVALHPSATLHTGAGRLILNRKWVRRDPFSALVSLGDGARMVVEGPFDAYSGHRIYVNSGALLEIGSGYANHNFNLSCFRHIKIGSHVFIGENVTLRDSDGHTLDGHAENTAQPIVIGDNVWIGMNVTILKGVTIGEGAVIAAGAVVTHDIPPHCLAAGVPAKVIRQSVSWK